MTTKRTKGWWRLGALMLGTLLLGLRAWGQVPYLEITVGTIDLLPNLAGQEVELWIENQGAEDFVAKALNLRLQIDDGQGGGNAPVFQGVNAVLGTPWEPVGPTVKTEVQESEYWDVRLFTDPFADSEVGVLGAGTSTLLATVTVNTTGLSTGSWAFRLAGMDASLGDAYTGSTDYAAVGGSQVFPAVINGQLTIVPEPETWALMGAVGLLGWAIARRESSRGQAGASDTSPAPGRSEG